jgi:hypothetical protein
MTESLISPARATGALRRTLPARARAAGIHLGISTVIFLVTLYLILVHWYPGFHFGVDGGLQGVRIMAAVDLVLGPTLTLIIFNPLKARRLIVFDLCCIGAAQFAALVWGFYAIYGQRPVSLNFYDGVFYSMPARSVRASPEAAAMLATLSQRPALIYVAMPANDSERRREAERATRRLLAHEDGFFFRALAPHWAEIQATAADPAKDPLLQQDLRAFLAQRGGQLADYFFFRYQGGYGSCILAFTQAGEPVDALGCVRA